MKVAMVASGQPRYTKYIFDNYYRIRDATSIELYFYMWNNYILNDHDKIIFYGEGSVEEQITKGLPENCTIKKFVTESEPSIEKLFPKGLDQLVEKTVGANYISLPEDMRVLLINLYMQRYSAMKAFELLDKEYDCVIRYRTDCFPADDIFLKQLNLDDIIYTPINLTAGGIVNKVPTMNDKFAIGNMKNMKVYFDAFHSLYDDQMENKELVQQETSLAFHLVKNNINVHTGPNGIRHFMVGIEKGDGGRRLQKI
jgi:hypothetical protein